MIRVMDPALVAQIKAGEVIERPASVVKELVENALDAGAGRIRIEIANGGTSLIRVVDDGAGIAPEELALAFAEHTSSKLYSPDGLGQIQSLGFRGEALHAICNVARVEAISGLRGSSVAGSASFDNGELVTAEPAASGGGTRIAVHDLFSKVPARRKHLRSARAESAAVHQVAAQYAIGHPEVALHLSSDARPMLVAPGTRRMEDAFASVYGPDLVDKMMPIRHEGRIAVTGLISPPDVTRSNRSAIHIFVNGRPVRSPALIYAIEDAYSGLLMVGRHPMAAIALTVPSEEIDVNVHPAKLEVRFITDRPIFSAVRAAVIDALSRAHAVTELKDDLGSEDWSDGNPPLLSVPEQPRPPYPEQISFPQKSPAPAAPLFGQTLPALRVFGQAGQTFIVAEGPSGLYMIDQHAAHERVIFDSLRSRENGGLRQPLLEPARVELSPLQWSALDTHIDQVRNLGFDVEEFGDRWLVLRSVPMVGKHHVDPEVLADVLDALAEARSSEDIVNGALTVVACKAAVKAGQTLSLSEMRELISLLEKADNPRTCPHGRPTTIHISTERLEKEFGRR